MEKTFNNWLEDPIVKTPNADFPAEQRTSISHLRVIEAAERIETEDRSAALLRKLLIIA
jgi:hypothetical protein